MFDVMLVMLVMLLIQECFSDITKADPTGCLCVASSPKINHLPAGTSAELHAATLLARSCARPDTKLLWTLRVSGKAATTLTAKFRTKQKLI